ncbi:uncharacterized protein LOC110839989 [Zootermopsis nevadensis]|uniref:uncharacterized protein LOC110839989 n=1 Tax=Zootermopsis nevadensis TaxID=136037 RepID=UPI000B8EA86B|nr:uncharacterized protein LOC110839989 [Zootermopsis nevadensis]
MHETPRNQLNKPKTEINVRDRIKWFRRRCRRFCCLVEDDLSKTENKSDYRLATLNNIMEDKVGYVKTEEGIKDVETCEPPQDIKQQEVIEEQAGNSNDGKSLDEECGDLRSVRDFLQTRVKELETQFQLAEETKDEICVYLEEQLYSLDTKIQRVPKGTAVSRSNGY